MSIKHIFLKDMVLKTSQGAAIVEANDIHLNNIQLLSSQTKPVLYVENSCNIELNDVHYTSNPELLLSVNGEKSSNIKLTHTTMPTSNNKVQYNNGANASMVVGIE